MGELGPDEGAENTYSLRPGLQHRFKSSTVKECIRAILKEKLADVQYIPEEMPELTKSLSDTIKDRLKEEGFDRYKMVVQVVIGEQRGEGVNMAARCFWDADTDSCAHDVFMNIPVGVWMKEVEMLLVFRCTDLGCTTSEDSLFCVVAAFGCFYY
ncbi:dynein light chain Tctex-type protein 2B isoform X1 [Passer domesticus]|uniref:dynein light chain Tctex-type protein 2B isoform X1 n=1 Tax=Passer domesticus TaxID=48849 RepID=UPI0030FED674